MKQEYTIEWVEERYQQDESLQFLFFWGHTNRTGQQVGKFCFSQWYELPFTVDSVTYATAEHWMMAQKALLFEDHLTYEKIVKVKKLGAVKALGREIMSFDEQV